MNRSDPVVEREHLRHLWTNDEYVSHGRELQEVSEFVWRDKYSLPHENTPDETMRRVANALAAVEVDDREQWAELFHQAMVMGVTPGGRIVANAGAEAERGQASLINCTVSQRIEDSIEGIMDAARNAAVTLSAGCGIGYDFSTLRPDGAEVAGVGATTSGPLNFMDIFDSTCKTISSAGGRRGAQMGVLDVRHPDIEAFIKAKRQNNRFTHFNISVLITDDFMAAVENDSYWDLIFPEMRRGRTERPNPEELVDADFPVPGPTEDYWVDEDRKTVACRVYKTIKARDLWEQIMQSTYKYSDPGFICIDRINRLNPLWFYEEIRATNPCGEVPLTEWGSCLLGSLDISAFVQEGAFKWEAFRTYARLFARMLDNVCKIARLPLPEQQAELYDKRRHGMGYLGLGTALALMHIRYGSQDAVSFTDSLTRELAVANWIAGLELAKEKGSAPALEDGKTTTLREWHIARCPQLAAVYQPGDVVSNRELWLLSKPIQDLLPYLPDGWADEVREHGVRYTQATSIAPTGTIASWRDNASGGVEPTFGHIATRNIIKQGRRTREDVPLLSAELRRLIDQGVLNGADDLPDWMDGANEVSAEDHVRTQAAAQKWIDSSISKTINVPPDCSYEDFVDIYKLGYRLGLKGCTTYRPNPDHRVGVLVNKDDMAEVRYCFHLEHGPDATAFANDKVCCDGETATIANLYQAVQAGHFRTFINDAANAEINVVDDVLHIGSPILSAELVKPSASPPAQTAPGSDFKRNRTLKAKAYKIERKAEGGNIYVIVSVQDDGYGYRPVEVFINGYDARMEPWASAFALVVTGMMRAGVDPSFMIEQIPQLRGYEPPWIGRSLFDSDDAKPRLIHSVVSEVVGAIKRTYDQLLKEQGFVPGPDGAKLDVDVVQEQIVEAAVGLICPLCGGSVEIAEGCRTCGSCGWSTCG